MEPNLQPRLDAHQISLDLDGLDEFLEVASDYTEGIVAVSAQESKEQQEGNERELILQLLDQIVCVNQSVEDARRRLVAANERMNSLTTVVHLQTEQLEMLNHFQNRAAKVTELEGQIDRLAKENERLRLNWWQKLLMRLRK